MLGEKHRLLDDFPEFTAQIEHLTRADEKFAADNSAYNELDEKIRKLELGGSPIGDDEMHLLKQQRAALKDKLYQALVSSKAGSD
jgi:uncharacterized protein YdcH (DUF465 family)